MTTHAPTRVQLLEEPVKNVTTWMLAGNSGREEAFRYLDRLESDDDDDDNKLVCSGENCGRDVVYQCKVDEMYLCNVCVRILESHATHAKEAVAWMPQVMKDDTLPNNVCQTCHMTPLTLPFYRCMVCVDYNLCETCEELNDDLVRMPRDFEDSSYYLHDPCHPVIKYRKPPPIPKETPH
jgi:hypothetical protein